MRHIYLPIPVSEPVLVSPFVTAYRDRLLNRRNGLRRQRRIVRVSLNQTFHSRHSLDAQRRCCQMGSRVRRNPMMLIPRGDSCILGPHLERVITTN